MRRKDEEERQGGKTRRNDEEAGQGGRMSKDGNENNEGRRKDMTKEDDGLESRIGFLPNFASVFDSFAKKRKNVFLSYLNKLLDK